MRAPDILSGIMVDPTQSARHRVDAIKTLDAFAANGPEAKPGAELFVIRIDLSGDGNPTEVYEKTVTLTKPLSSSEPWPDASTTPQKTLEAIPTKEEDDDDGEPV